MTGHGPGLPPNHGNHAHRDVRYGLADGGEHPEEELTFRGEGQLSPMSRIRRRPGRLLFGHGHGLWADWMCRRTCRSSRWRRWVISCWNGPALVTCLSCRTRALASWRPQHRAHRGRHLPGALLAGVIFCEGAPPAQGGMAGGARSRVRPGTAGWLTPGGASSSITHEPDRLLDSRCRWSACWLRVLLVGPSLAGGSQQAGRYPARSAACSEPRQICAGRQGPWPTGG